MTGHLKVRNGIYYAVINFKDRNGKYKQKWISTGLKERGNKKQAKEFLEEKLNSFKDDDVSENISVPQNNISFMDFVKKYIEDKKTILSPSTYAGYLHITKPYTSFMEMS